MLHIILLVLKIIGIVLLCIVGLLLAAIACVLFVPVRYRVRLMREEGERKPAVVAHVKVTWLLHLVNVLIRYPAKVLVRARIFLFTLFRIPRKEKKARKGHKSRRHKEETSIGTDDQDAGKQAGEISLKERKIPTATAATKEYQPFGQDEDDFTLHESEPEESEETGKKFFLFARIGSIFKKIKDILKKIKAFFENIQYTIRKFCDKIENVSDNIQYYREVLESDSFRQSAGLCRDELGRVFGKLKPDKFEADLIVGMEDPASTGEILAICGILYPLIGPHVRVVGDFECEKTRIEGRLYIRGKIRVITFIRTAVRIYFNKNIKELIKLLEKEAV